MNYRIKKYFFEIYKSGFYSVSFDESIKTVLGP